MLTQPLDICAQLASNVADRQPGEGVADGRAVIVGVELLNDRRGIDALIVESRAQSLGGLFAREGEHRSLDLILNR